MKLLKYIFKKREESTTELETVELWVVKWLSISLDREFCTDGTVYSPKTNWEHKAFISKESADLFESELRAAFKLTGCRRCNISTAKQESHTNI